MESMTMTCGVAVNRIAVPVVSGLKGIRVFTVNPARTTYPVFRTGDDVVATASGIHQPSIESPPV